MEKHYESKKVLTVLAVVVLLLIFNIILRNYTSVVFGHVVSSQEPLPVPTSIDHYKWKTDSPYTIVNYFSLDCPHCRNLDKIENQNKESYSKTFSLIYRNSPLPSQPLSGEKGVMVECVNSISGGEHLFDFISDIYEHFDAQADNNDWVVYLAGKYVKDNKQFLSCINGPEIRSGLIKEKNVAISYGVVGTPTIGLFKNGVLVLRLDMVSEHSVKRLMDSLVLKK